MLLTEYFDARLADRPWQRTRTTAIIVVSYLTLAFRAGATFAGHVVFPMMEKVDPAPAV